MMILWVFFISNWVNAEPVECLERFIAKYEQSAGYSTLMKKTEFVFGDAKTENLKIEEREKKEIILTFMDKGSSGIKNNGMTVHYKGGEKVSITIGKSKGLGFLLNGLAETFSAKEKGLYSSAVIEDQIFTVNRAGFGFFARTLRKKLSDIKSGRAGKLIQTSTACELEFRAAEGQYSMVDVLPSEPMRDIEEQYGILAYTLYLDNPTLFKKFKDVFVRKKPLKIQIAHATSFNLKLDGNALPKLVELLWDNEVIGRYEFSQTTLF